ncbi:nose resistant to fluoxetine protein 6-like [Teleopsis dalmanni]|uniref:nose resistant to fluoxetine protein 6-like n=1 Tax=Teleopsis dalmanni TaxID=139649 RepID=UPI000D32A8D9|nr:nose resistant to fluoxetine protein 6-like [Teleopsis dalmanni]
MKCLLTLFFCFVCLRNAKSQYPFNMSEYLQMPPLYQLDDYDACLHYSNKPTKTYCVVYAEIVPDPFSKAWQRVEHFSVDFMQRYRHDRLFMGVCVERCESVWHGFNISQRQVFNSGPTDDAALKEYYDNVHIRSTKERQQYEVILNVCLNYEFQQKYQLQIKTNIEYCQSSDEAIDKDALDYTLYFIFLSIALFSVMSTIYDSQLKAKAATEKQQFFYETELTSTAQRYLTSFSVCRNFKRLTASPTGKTANDLKFLNFARVIPEFVIIFGHTAGYFMSVQVSNTEFVENFIHYEKTSFLENYTAVIVQIFFIMSSFLLTLLFNKRNPITPNSGFKECVKAYFKIFIYRYLRLVPTLALVLLFNATLMPRLHNGPFWRHLTEAERIFCRQNWWKNIFFVNNLTMDKSCTQHSWYISADTQLFAIFLFVLIFNARYPKMKKIIYTLLLISAIAIPAFIVYHKNIDPIMRINPEIYRYMFFKGVKTFYEIHIPFYTHLGAYILGIITAEIYMKLQNHMQSKSYRGVWWTELCWLTLFITLISFPFVGVNLTNKSSLWLGLYAGLYKNVWALFCCLILISTCYKLGGILYDLLSSSILQPLANISYQAFLWHVLALHLLLSYYRQPMYLNTPILVYFVILSLLITNLIAFFMTIFVEYPSTEIVNCLCRKSKDNFGRRNNKSPVTSHQD